MNAQKDKWTWWKHGIFYHIYPRSFCDSNNDGIGDINGITAKLQYLSGLGITAIWISPVCKSPMKDLGYDIMDYRNIDPVFGSLDDFRRLLEEAHRQGIRIVMDLVMNHTSGLHPWFIESRSSKDNPKRDWYIWQDGRKNRRPNNWHSAFGTSAWEYDAQTGQYYLHSFFKEMPDLNWRNKKLKKAFFEEVRFWLDMGVDGFRLDVINMIVKDKKFRNNPLFFGIPWIQKHVYTRNRRKSQRITHQLRNLLDGYNDRMSVGEIYAMPPGDPALAADYLGKGDDSIHLAFDFSLIFQPWNARKFSNCLENWYRQIPEKGWACNVLSNHDLFRSNSRFGRSRNYIAKSKIMAMFLLTARGTPFIYYGEEIGMTNGKIKRNQVVDPLGKKFWPFFKGRDRARTPMQWNDRINAGFSESKPWLPVNQNYKHINVEAELKDPGSVLSLYKKLILLHNNSEVLQKGDFIPVIKGNKGILAFSRRYSGKELFILLNFRKRPVRIIIPATKEGTILISTHRNEGNRISIRKEVIYPFEATMIELNS